MGSTPYRGAHAGANGDNGVRAQRALRFYREIRRSGGRGKEIGVRKKNLPLFLLIS
jgi:hypothetical protein